MRGRSMIALVLTLVVAVVVLSVRLYTSVKQLDRAEQYLASATMHWSLACVQAARNLDPSSPLVSSWAINSMQFCVPERDWEEIRAMVNRGEGRAAEDLAERLVEERRLPWLIDPDEYDRSVFPVGYR